MFEYNGYHDENSGGGIFQMQMMMMITIAAINENRIFMMAMVPVRAMLVITW